MKDRLRAVFYFEVKFVSADRTNRPPVLSEGAFEPKPAQYDIDQPARPYSRDTRRSALPGSGPKETTNRSRRAPPGSRRRPRRPRSKTRTSPSFASHTASRRLRGRRREGAEKRGGVGRFGLVDGGFQDL